MKPLTLITAASLCLAAAHANAQLPSNATPTGAFALYDPATGAITFRNFDNGELGIRLNSAGGNLLANATDLDGAASGLLGVVNDTQVPNFIEWGQFAGFNFTSAFAGNVVVPGTPPRDLSIDVAPRNGALIPPLIFIPEPSAAAITACGILGLASTRTRRSPPARFSC